MEHLASYDTMDSISNLQELNSQPELSRQWLTLCQIIPEFYIHMSRTSEDPSVFHKNNVVCTVSHCTLPSERSVEDTLVLDSILNWYRESMARGFKSAIMWYLDPIPPINLDARLYARGVCPNWEPHWMYCEIKKMMKVEKSAEKFNIRVKAEHDEASKNKGSCLVWKVFALREGEWLGGCTLMVATNEHSAGGLFDMFVQPQQRKQGIGFALTISACELALEAGCDTVLLNATDEGESVYGRAGFLSMGKGRSWFLNGDVLARPRPSSTQVKILEAIGVGDIEALNEMKGNITLDQISEETVNGETPLEIAVRCKKPASSQWLIDNGVVPDIMSLWDLGWRDRIPVLLSTHPELVQRKAGRWAATPLHVAIERDDVEMVNLLLSVPYDFEIKDGVMNSTPMGWAKYLQRTEIIVLLESAKSKV